MQKFIYFYFCEIPQHTGNLAEVGLPSGTFFRFRATLLFAGSFDLRSPAERIADFTFKRKFNVL